MVLAFNFEDFGSACPEAVGAACWGGWASLGLGAGVPPRTSQRCRLWGVGWVWGVSPLCGEENKVLRS